MNPPPIDYESTKPGTPFYEIKIAREQRFVERHIIPADGRILCMHGLQETVQLDVIQPIHEIGLQLLDCVDTDLAIVIANNGSMHCFYCSSTQPRLLKTKEY